VIIKLRRRLIQRFKFVCFPTHPFPTLPQTPWMEQSLLFKAQKKAKNEYTFNVIKHRSPINGEGIVRKSNKSKKARIKMAKVKIKAFVKSWIAHTIALPWYKANSYINTNIPHMWPVVTTWNMRQLIPVEICKKKLNYFRFSIGQTLTEMRSVQCIVACFPLNQ